MMSENLKRGRGDITSTSSKQYENNLLKHSRPINKNISNVNIPPTQPSNITQVIIKTAYNENRLKSMSHIKQINPKYRNYVIPVLPGAFNKFSNI